MFRELPEALMEREAIREDISEAVQKVEKASTHWPRLLRLVDSLMTPADIALLIGGPLVILLFLWEVHRQGKLVLKWRGLFRFPAALLVSTFGVLGTSLLYAKVNPYVRDSPHSCVT